MTESLTSPLINDEIIWKEYKEFLKAHEIQLYAMGFPIEKLGEKLFFKLKYEIFENNIFSLEDHEDSKRVYVKTNQNMIQNQDVFLIDHCWTFKIRQFHEFADHSPNVINRVFKMLKYADKQQDLMTKDSSSNTKTSNLKDKVSQLKNIELRKSKNLPVSEKELEGLRFLDYDNLNITDSHLEEVYVPHEAYAISLEGNKLRNINLLVKFLILKPQIKAIWIDEYSYKDDKGEEIEVDTYKILNQIKNIRNDK